MENIESAKSYDMIGRALSQILEKGTTGDIPMQVTNQVWDIQSLPIYSWGLRI